MGGEGKGRDGHRCKQRSKYITTLQNVKSDKNVKTFYIYGEEGERK